ncbi:hypothetical protein BZA05DRAFT_202302 [Tricharina praecox]|uniref:uncharacterized protein n=1 Tax=Tricharina praecox TaxID=43433 RepID=UPI00221FF410|nr:uncharacterized protein BZA05DRAFT_202302 [Tricharina praecox]KAI5856477.1 hypothetical protein BZA05DRAFT_202302 [Tricharina praecox]
MRPLFLSLVNILSSSHLLVGIPVDWSLHPEILSPLCGGTLISAVGQRLHSTQMAIEFPSPKRIAFDIPQQS